MDKQNYGADNNFGGKHPKKKKVWFLLTNTSTGMSVLIETLSDQEKKIGSIWSLDGNNYAQVFLIKATLPGFAW